MHTWRMYISIVSILRFMAVPPLKDWMYYSPVIPLCQ